MRGVGQSNQEFWFQAIPFSISELIAIRRFILLSTLFFATAITSFGQTGIKTDPIKGIYFGQTLPGETPVLFAPEVLASVSAALNIGFSDANYGDGLFVNGKVGIGTTTTGSYLMAVNGTIRTKEVVVSTQGWPDFVFDPSYRLSPIADVEQFIKANKRLPGMPSAQQVEKEGLEIGVMQSKLLQKIEELTLHLIELKKENELMKTEITALKEK